MVYTCSGTSTAIMAEDPFMNALVPSLPVVLTMLDHSWPTQTSIS